MVIDCRNYQSNKHGMSWRFHSPLDVGFVPAFAMRASNKKFNRPSSPGLNPRNWRVRRCLGGPTLDPKKGTKEWACHCWGAKSFLGQAVARYRNCNFQSHHVIQNWVLSPPELSVRYDVDELDDLGKRSKRVQLDLFQLALACWSVTLPYVRRAMLKSSAQMAVSQRRKWWNVVAILRGTHTASWNRYWKDTGNSNYSTWYAGRKEHRYLIKIIRSDHCKMMELTGCPFWMQWEKTSQWYFVKAFCLSLDVAFSHSLHQTSIFLLCLQARGERTFYGAFEGGFSAGYWGASAAILTPGTIFRGLKKNPKKPLGMQRLLGLWCGLTGWASGTGWQGWRCEL